MPGSRLLGQPEPGTYEGEVKVKVGPLGVAYTGQFSVLDADDRAARLTCAPRAASSAARATPTRTSRAWLSERDGGGTLVQIDTDLSIRGKVAQFGRGVIGEVTDGIMQTFARNVEQMLLSGGTPQPCTGAPAATLPPHGRPRRPPPPTKPRCARPRDATRP